MYSFPRDAVFIWTINYGEDFEVKTPLFIVQVGDRTFQLICYVNDFFKTGDFNRISDKRVKIPKDRCSTETLEFTNEEWEELTYGLFGNIEYNPRLKIGVFEKREEKLEIIFGNGE